MLSYGGSGPATLRAMSPAWLKGCSGSAKACPGFCLATGTTIGLARLRVAARAGRAAILLAVFVTGFVNLYTRDIEAGLHFYRDLLGFTETFRTPAQGVPEHVELRLNEFMVGLGTVEAARRVHGVEAAPGSPVMVLVVWTDDVDRAYASLAARDARTLSAPHDFLGTLRAAWVADPDGNPVQIVMRLRP